MNQPGQSLSKKKKGLFNSKGKKPGRETVTSNRDPGSMPRSDGIDLDLMPDDHFDNQISDPRFSDSN